MRHRISTAFPPPLPFLAILLALAVILPPYVERGFDIHRIPELTAFILTHSIRHEASQLFPVANLLGILALTAILVTHSKATRLFSGLVALAYLLSALLQNVSVSEQHGLAINTSTMLLTLLVALSWLKMATGPTKAVSDRSTRRRAVVLVPLALIAIWQPVSPTSLLPDFRASGFLESGAFLTFCMTTTVALSVLLMHFPGVDMHNLQTTSVVGLLVGIGNLWLEWLYLPALAWVGVLHVPLVVLSVLGLNLSVKELRRAAAQQLAEADPAGWGIG